MQPVHYARPATLSNNQPVKMRVSKGNGASAWKYALVLFSVVFVSSCSSKSLSLIFDIPVEEEAQKAPEQVASQESAVAEESDVAASSFPGEQEDERPPIEETLDWDEAQAMLPKDAFGQVDWMQALRDGVIRPRSLDPDARKGEVFKLDFYFKNDNPMFDAYFPHTAHTQWLSCKNCHGSIFPYRDNDITMGDIFQKKFCGTCHGVVSFTLNACTRCHRSM
jgi:c(7)-type cytochrome triheme protein